MTGEAGRGATAAPSIVARDRACVLACPIDRLDMEQTLARCEELIAARGFAQHLAVNAAKLVAMRDDPELRAVGQRCALVSADGQAVVWAARMLGDPLPERVAGIDLMHELLALSERRGYRVYILGAKLEVLGRAVERIRASHPALAIAGYRDGYFDDDESARVAAEIESARADILFVAMPTPRKERWLDRHGRDTRVPLVMGVGGSVDVIAGLTSRAPLILQRLGLEWLYRLGQEPRRLMRRYLVTNARFIMLLVRELASRRGPGA